MSNKKIWSIPIAALALMLMLAAALVTTGIVQAQNLPAQPSISNASFVGPAGQYSILLKVDNYDAGDPQGDPKKHGPFADDQVTAVVTHTATGNAPTASVSFTAKDTTFHRSP